VPSPAPGPPLFPHAPLLAGLSLLTPRLSLSRPTASLLTIAKEEGFGALYKGFTPKVLRLAPGGGVLLLVVEVVLEQFRNTMGPPYI
jgi:solute carrier family 25 2-oxodicarboxylate transporter 21